MNDERTPMEALRHFAEISGYVRESLWDGLTRAQCLALYDAWQASEWDIFPDQWSQAQLTDALRYGIAPAFDANEQPLTYEAR